MAKKRARKAAANGKQRQGKRKHRATGKKSAISKALSTAKRSVAGKKKAVAQALSDGKRTAAAKWAWVTRQLNTKRA